MNQSNHANQTAGISISYQRGNVPFFVTLTQLALLAIHNG